MNIQTIKTPKVQRGSNIFKVLETTITSLKENEIVVVTSKIISICQGRVIKNNGLLDKVKLIKQEADYVLQDEALSRYGVVLTINHNILIANSGIDESNGNGYFVLWPSKPSEQATLIWNHLRKKHQLNNLGVIITDSHTTPLRWGVTGIGLAWCGFKALKNYIGTKDIFGRKLHATKASVLDGLAAAAAITMGEGNEQTPLAVISDVSFVEFQDRPPTDSEVNALKINLKDDIYAPLVNSPRWKKVNSSK